MRRYLCAPLALFVLIRIGGAVFDPDPSASATPVPVPPGSHWIATWGASPQAATAGNLSRAGFRNATIREIVLTSAGGARVRVRLTNAFGTGPIRIGPAAVAIDRSGPNTASGTSHPLYFGGRRSGLNGPGDPNAAGYRAMAAAINLRALVEAG